jgi:hypothetical protein
VGFFERLAHKIEVGLRLVHTEDSHGALGKGGDRHKTDQRQTQPALHETSFYDHFFITSVCSGRTAARSEFKNGLLASFGEQSKLCLEILRNLTFVRERFAEFLAHQITISVGEAVPCHNLIGRWGRICCGKLFASPSPEAERRRCMEALLWRKGP